MPPWIKRVKRFEAIPFDHKYERPLYLYSYSTFHKPVLFPLDYNVDLPDGTHS